MWSYLSYIWSYLSYSWSYLRLGYTSYRYITHYRESGIHELDQLDHILQLVNRCGSVTTKFVQWITPKLELMLIEESEFFKESYDTHKPPWLRKMEVFYEECPEHSLDHTLQEYEKVFKTSLTDQYTPIRVIGSGSIGQVYLLSEKSTEELCVMKILHPEIQHQIHIFKMWVWILSHTPKIKSYRHKSIFDIFDFINDFK
jgi:predicted unusual protein kinase regulating ubiquinone biosynthesis (AarF/ABC1/UbiB family)